MSVYQKLSEARAKFHTVKLQKTGHNKFAGYNYFDLGDFLVPALSVMREAGLVSVITFGKDVATMRIIDMDKPDDQIVIESPMSSASLKGAHDIQNLGAVQTYLRRYLWVAALEIVEHDAIDSTTGKAPKGELPASIKHRPADGAIVAKERIPAIMQVVNAVLEHFDADDVVGALEEIDGLTDAEEKTFAWDKLPSKVRTAITKQRTTTQGDF